MAISIVKAELLALFLEALVYGIFFCLYFLLLIVIAQDKRGGAHAHRQDFVIWVASIMMVFTTAHLVIDAVRAFVGLTGETDAAEAFFHSVTNGSFLAKTVLWMGQTVLGDGILIWRCYVVYGRRILYVSPMIAGSILYVCSASAILYNFTHSQPGATSVFTGQYQKWIVLYFSCTMYINILCSGAMAYQIIRKTRPMRRTGAVMPVLVAIIDTAALYTTGYIGLLISFLSGSDGQFAAVDVIMPLIGVTFVLIFLQTRFRELLSTSGAWSSGARITETRSQFSERLRQRYGFSPQRGPSQGLNTTYPTMTAITVEITQETEVDRDEERGRPRSADKPMELETIKSESTLGGRDVTGAV